MSSANQAAACLRYYHRKRAAFLARGLNTRGRPYQRRPSLTPEDRRAVNLAKYHRRAAANRAAGLTTRGTRRKRNDLGAPSNPVEIAWRQFRAEMAIPASPSCE